VIVFGEPNGHIETLSETHGPRLADFVVETGRSVVLSLLGFESDQSERRFVAPFLRQLYRRKSRQGQPTRTLVVLDEAHLFVPENVRGDAAELAGAASGSPAGAVVRHRHAAGRPAARRT
jgi:DNA helicase HerA-like ATPase